MPPPPRSLTFLIRILIRILILILAASLRLPHADGLGIPRATGRGRTLLPPLSDGGGDCGAGAGEEGGDLRADVASLLSRLSPPNHGSDADDGAATTTVHLMGTGLASTLVESLTLPALSVLAGADVVLHDALSLSPGEIRRIVGPSCVVRGVGKRGSGGGTGKEGGAGGAGFLSATQDEIDALLLRYALGQESCGDGEGEGEDLRRRPRTIVRLKGGDPYLFGRSRTEIDTLRSLPPADGVAYRVWPNLSSCVAGPHVAGIPLTDPLIGSQSFAVFSGTDRSGAGIGEDGEDRWQGMDVDALVFLMIGRIDKLGGLRDRLVGSGSGFGAEGGAEGGRRRWAGGTPCAVVRSAGRPEQTVWRSTLSSIVEDIREDLGEGCETVSPAIFVVGRTAELDLRPEGRSGT